MDELEPVLGQRQRAQERRGERVRVDRRADVMDEAGEGQLGRARPSPDRVGGLEHLDRAARAGEHDRRGQPVRAGADDDGVRQTAASPRAPGHPSCTGSSGWPKSARRCATSTTGGAGRRTRPACRRARPARRSSRPARVSVWFQKRSSCAWPPSVSPSSKIGSEARISTCAWATVSPSRSVALKVIQPANMWPSGVISVNDSSSAYSTITPVDSFILPGSAMFEQRHLARLDAGQRARRTCCRRARTRGSAASR